MPLAQFKKISSLAAICCSSSCSNREPRWEKNTKKVFCERSKAKYMWVVSMNEQPVGALSGFQEHISSTDESRSQCTECRSSWKLPNVNTMNIAALNSTAHIAALNSTARDCSSCRRVRNYILKFEEVEKKKNVWVTIPEKKEPPGFLYCTVYCEQLVAHVTPLLPQSIFTETSQSFRAGTSTEKKRRRLSGI